MYHFVRKKVLFFDESFILFSESITFLKKVLFFSEGTIFYKSIIFVNSDNFRFGAPYRRINLGVQKNCFK